MIVAIDPGPERSAYVEFNGDRVTASRIMENDELRVLLRTMHGRPYADLAIEMIASYGMAVGREVFDTCVWIGRFVEAWGMDHTKVYRKDVKLHLCGTTKAKDSNIRQALIDKFGGKERAIGNKKQPGPLYGLRADMWAALAVAVTYSETRQGV